MRGSIKPLKFESKILKNNPLGDPWIRDILIYLPESYSNNKSKDYPTIILLPSYGNDNRSFRNTNPFSPTIFERLEKLIDDKICGEMIIVIPNCFNSLGGSQYTNSSAIGNYNDYIIYEIIPHIESKYNIGKKALIGKSSGGYGAMVFGMKYPKIFSAIAAHSFDSAFEYCYLKDFPITFKTLKKSGGIKEWYTNFWKKEFKEDKNDFITLSILSMAAHYSPNLKSQMKIDLPFDLESGEINHDIWKSWKKMDPINLIYKYKENLKKMAMIYFDCGLNDEFNLFIGNRIFSKRCNELGIDHEYREYEGGHFNTSYRYNISLPKIYDKIQQ